MSTEQRVGLQEADDDLELIYVRHLVKHFDLGSSVFDKIFSRGPKGEGAKKNKEKLVHAVDDVSFRIDRNETLGLVGESGSGKSTLGRCVLGLIPPTSGTVLLDGRDVNSIGKRDLAQLRKRMQIVFQDPVSSLDPMMKIKDAIAEPLAATGTSSKEETHEAVGRIMDAVGLNREYANRFPHEFSGGQRQRIGIARAFISSPDFVVLDEPTSALDASTQAQILNLLKRLKSDFHLSTLFITHNMKVVSFMSDRIAVMYLGEIVEIGTTGEVISDPLHPYTMMLIASIPKGDPESRMLSDVGRRKKLLDLSGGEIPSPINPPSGCRFHTRCPYVMEKCRTQVPRHARVSPTRTVQCFLYSEESTTTAKGQPE